MAVAFRCRDLKSSNVLLTGNGIAKISDHGMAKLAEADESSLRVAGTFACECGWNLLVAGLPTNALARAHAHSLAFTFRQPKFGVVPSWHSFQVPAFPLSFACYWRVTWQPGVLI